VIAPLPEGFGIAADPDTKAVDEHTLYGGAPARVMRLSAAGRAAWQELQGAPVATPAAGALARRLTDAGMAHPRPPRLHGAPDVTVVVPARERAEMLDACLGALGDRFPVVVVDDGSARPETIAAVAEHHGARLVRRSSSGGPAAARNRGVAEVRSELVAFVDSDCVPAGDWIERLACHFADPLVAAVAPRIVPADSPRTSRRSVEAYSAVNGSLDLGARAARVVPASRVPYVPAAALVVRRAALAAASSGALPAGAEAFDTSLRYGEDVDLVWRLHEAGWRIRYDPAVRVAHHEPRTWRELLVRRFRYGTSAAPLARRHPEATVPLVLQPGPALAVVGLLGRRTALVGSGVAVSALALASGLRRARLPQEGLLRGAGRSLYQTWLGVGRYADQFAAPALLAALIVARRGTRLVLAALVLGPALDRLVTRRPAMDPVRFALAQLADSTAYGAGVWLGCARERTLRPLRPVVVWHPVRSGSSGKG